MALWVYCSDRYRTRSVQAGIPLHRVGTRKIIVHLQLKKFITDLRDCQNPAGLGYLGTSLMIAIYGMRGRH